MTSISSYLHVIRGSFNIDIVLFQLVFVLLNSCFMSFSHFALLFDVRCLKGYFKAVHVEPYMHIPVS